MSDAAEGRRRWPIAAAAAGVVSALTVWAVPLYQDSGSGELRTLQGIIAGEDAWVLVPVLVIGLFPLLAALQLWRLGPRPPRWARALLAAQVLFYGACVLMGMLMVALEGAIFTFGGGTMRADNLLVDAAAWIAVLWWIAVGLVGAVLVFREW